MALKAIIDNLDEVAESFRVEYKEGSGEQSGKYVLDLEDDVKIHPKVKNLQTAHERTKRDKATIQAKLTEAEDRLEGLPEDFNADKYAELEAKAKLGEGKEAPKADEEIARVRTQMETKHAKELTKKDERIGKLEKAVEKHVVEDKLTGALVDAGVRKELLPAARALLKGKVKISEEDDDFDAVVETDMGRMTVAEFVTTWAGSDDGKPFVEKIKGGGSNGGDGGRKPTEHNPFDKEGGHYNLTAQQEMMTSDRPKAERMAAAAGVKLPATAA
jgi:hypothetical protein